MGWKLAFLKYVQKSITDNEKQNYIFARVDSYCKIYYTYMSIFAYDLTRGAGGCTDSYQLAHRWRVFER